VKGPGQGVSQGLEALCGNLIGIDNDFQAMKKRGQVFTFSASFVLADLIKTVAHFVSPFPALTVLLTCNRPYKGTSLGGPSDAG
jgi:hypothetical protein